MDTNAARTRSENGEIERATAVGSLAAALSISIALVAVTQSGSVLRPLLDVEPIRSVPYARAALITLADLAIVFLLLRLVGLSSATLATLSGLFTPISSPFVFAVLTLGPAIAACAVFVPLAPAVSAADLAWKVFAGPFFEELVYRGLAVGVLMRVCGWPLVAACLWPAIFFGAAHAWQGGDLTEIAGIVAITAAGGLLFGWLYVRWRFNLWPSIFLHSGLNGVWLMFDLGENAIGGWFGNGLRFVVVGFAIAATLWLTRLRPPRSIPA